ncbi:MAG: helix-turn-helix domain-containing protein [Microbacteriaceae bacterium]
MPTAPDVTASAEEIDLARLGAMLRARRGNLSLRAAALDADVSFSTFSRVEDGHHPDLATFTKLCAWLGVSPAMFFADAAERQVSPLEQAVAHLQADPALSPDAAGAIAGMLKEMYAKLATESAPQRELAVACHLRAGTVLRPGVAPRLGAILTDINHELERRAAAGVL